MQGTVPTTSFSTSGLTSSCVSSTPFPLMGCCSTHLVELQTSCSPSIRVHVCPGLATPFFACECECLSRGHVKSLSPSLGMRCQLLVHACAVFECVCGSIQMSACDCDCTRMLSSVVVTPSLLMCLCMGLTFPPCDSSPAALKPSCTARMMEDLIQMLPCSWTPPATVPPWWRSEDLFPLFSNVGVSVG